MDYSVKGLKGPKPKVIFRCPSCHAKMNGSLKHAGDKISCPRCQASLTVPGLHELAAWVKFSEHMRAEKSLAESQQEPSQTEQEESAPAERPETDPPFIKINRGDKILHLAFGFFKSISVLAICLTVAIIACTVIWVAWTWSGQPPGPNSDETFHAPDAVAFASHCEELERDRQRDNRPSRLSDLDSPSLTGEIDQDSRFSCNGHEKQIDLVIEKLFFDLIPKPMSDETQNYVRGRMRTNICYWLRWEVVSEAEGIEGLVEFAKAFNQDKKLQECLTPEDALIWYQDAWAASREKVSDAKESRLWAAQALWNRKIGVLTIGGQIIGISLAGLMVLIILPLLIQIERNTRKTGSPPNNAPPYP